MIFKCCLLDCCFNYMEKSYINRFLLAFLILITISFFIWYVFFLISMVVYACCSINLWRLNLVVHCLGVERPNTCSCEPKIDGFLCERLIYNLIYPFGHNGFIWFQVIFRHSWIFNLFGCCFKWLETRHI
jgi:hypothetical protein